jgi:RNA polymerase sigma-70 factor (ECF subfamily)
MRECLNAMRGTKKGHTSMTNQSIANERILRDGAVTERFLETPSEESFADLFNTFRPQLVAFFRARSCELALAEDLTQEVMLTVYRKATQVRDRTLFRAWLFKIARNAICRHYGKKKREVETVDLTDVNDRLAASPLKAAGTPAFEFMNWMDFLDSREREVMALRFIEEWEYHEIAAAKAMPIGTVQWRVFNAKKKLAPHLSNRQNMTLKAA